MLALAIPAFRETSDDDWVKKSELAVTFLDRYGNEIGTRGIKHNDALRLDEFPDHLIKATLATEDRRFYEHFGIDIPGLFRAMATNARAGGVVQGGSSISQQLAKNLFLSNERTIERKVKEAFLAIWLEVRLPKNEILKLYLDRAYMGGGTFGVDAAAQYYFNKSARDVNLAEAAMLAGLFKAPSRFAPHINLPAARARANVVLDNLVEAGFMTEGQVFGARRNPAMAVDRRDERSPNYYLDWAFDEMKKLTLTLPKIVHERVFVVRLAHRRRRPEARREDGREPAQAVRPRIPGEAGRRRADGHRRRVRAMVGGRDYGESQFNRATDALRQPGSSFKPYVYAAALASGGFKPNSIVVDSPVCIGNWCPKNYSGGFSGSMTLTMALTRSINVIPVKLSIALGNGNPKLGRAKIRETGAQGRHPLAAARHAVDADRRRRSHGARSHRRLRDLRQCRQGDHAACGARSAQQHRRPDLALRSRRQASRCRSSPRRSRADMNMMMNSVVEAGTARRAILDGIKSAGKTGTTNAHRDAWFVGYTGNFIMGVWYGNDDYSPMHQMTGGSLPAQTWHDIMEFAHQGVELRNIPGIAPNGSTVGKTLADSAKDAAQQAARPTVLTKRGTDVLVRVERMMDDATRALATSGASEQGRRGPGSPRSRRDAEHGGRRPSGRRPRRLRGIRAPDVIARAVL